MRKKVGAGAEVVSALEVTLFGTQTHYQPPSTISPFGLVAGGAAAVVASLLLAPLYAYATVYIPFVYVNAILTVMFGIILGVTTVTALRAGNFHNQPLSWLVVAGAALFAYWLHWMWWFSALAFRADIEDFTVLSMAFPPTLLSAVAEMNAVGTWSLRSTDPVSGWVLSFVWVVEALVYFVAALASGGFLIGSGTYCGGCKRWCDELNVTRLQRDETGALAARVNEAQDWSVLLRPAPADGEGEWHQVTIHQCPTCKQTSTVTIHDVSVSHDAKGNEERQEKLVADRVYIRAEDLARLLNTAG